MTSRTSGACPSTAKKFHIDSSGRDQLLSEGHTRPFAFILWTKDPELAALGDEAGIDWIGVDLESLGKAERQANKNTRLSGHSLDDLARVRRRLSRARCHVRVNPLGPSSPDEIARAIDLGAEALMLPYFHTLREVDTFLELIAGRAESWLLVETVTAAFRIDLFAAAGASMVYLGMTDMYIDAKLESHLEALTSPLTATMAAAVRAAGIPLGAAALGRWDDTSLPLKPDFVYAECVRLGAECSLISRSFLAGLDCERELAAAVAGARRRIAYWRGLDRDELERVHRHFRVATQTARLPAWDGAAARPR